MRVQTFTFLARCFVVALLDAIDRDAAAFEVEHRFSADDRRNMRVGEAEMWVAEEAAPELLAQPRRSVARALVCPENAPDCAIEHYHGVKVRVASVYNGGRGRTEWLVTAQVSPA